VEALLYEKQEDGSVICGLCNHRCHIRTDGYGKCKVRQNINGTLETLVYGKLIAINPDPIEKKPLYHFLPGTLTYSIATVGCNFRCTFCQNMEISQMPREHGRIEGTPFSPEEVVADALRHQCRSISFTYTEPTVFFEFAHDTARLAQANGLKTVFVSNGYMTTDAIDKIAPWLDAANIDLKAFSETFYKEQCGARLEPVKQSLTYLKARGIFLEVTTLLIPGLNDSTAELKAMADFIVYTLGPRTPWHISRFHPAYNMPDVSPTPMGRLTEAYEIGKKAGLKYVYIGNVAGHTGSNTYCPSCGKTLVKRAGHFQLQEYMIQNGCCMHCFTPIDGVDM